MGLDRREGFGGGVFFFFFFWGGFETFGLCSVFVWREDEIK